MRRIVGADAHDRNRSLGWLAVAWMEHFVVHGPGGIMGQPVQHGDEYTGFLVDCYALDEGGRLLYDSAFFSRPKGCDKSGLGARLAIFEALGPARFAGFAKGGEVYRFLDFTYVYATGEPMGKSVTAPFIRCMATEEGQTGNVYDTIHYNFTQGPLRRVVGLNPGLTRILLPHGGEITPSTASSASKDGGKETFVVFDESHLYTLPELRRMYATVTRNLRKRKFEGTWFLETTTMFAPGEDSVAEDTYKKADLVEAGKARRQRVLFDHRWGECDDLTDVDKLRVELIEAYGEAAEWNDIEGLIDEFHDVSKSTADSRRYFLNAPTSTYDSWIAAFEWTGAARRDAEIADGDTIVVGFDGSRSRARGVTDSTALIGCRISDGLLFEIAVWEQPPNFPRDKVWSVDTAAVNARVADTFERFDVIGFYCDPAKWETYVAEWEATYGPRLKVKATRDHPCQWWMTGGRSRNTVQALEQFANAVFERELTHTDSPTLTSHVLNARRKPTRSGVQIGKEHPDSPRKIDAAVAAVLAWQARLDSVAAGLSAPDVPMQLVRRLR